MSKVSFTVPGKPQAKARPRSTRSGIVYTPKNTVLYENLVRTSFVEKYPEFVPETGYVEAEITAYFPIPKSKSKRIRILMEKWFIRPKTKPDVDNITKSILDSLNEIAFRDDSQVTDLTIRKRYSEQPRVDVTLTFEDMEEEDGSD